MTRCRCFRFGNSAALAVALAMAVALSSHFVAVPYALARDSQSAANLTAGGSASAAPVAAPGAAFALPPLSALPQTRERPLFSPGRRPPPAVAPPPKAPAAVAPPTPPAAKPQTATFVLTGIAWGPDARVAIVRNVGTNVVSRVQRGETVDGWAVVEIEARAVLLRNGPATTRLELFPTPEARR